MADPKCGAANRIRITSTSPLPRENKAALFLTSYNNFLEPHPEQTNLIVQPDF